MSQCSRCSAPVSVGERFCGRCGAPLLAPAPAPPLSPPPPEPRRGLSERVGLVLGGVGAVMLVGLMLGVLWLRAPEDDPKTKPVQNSGTTSTTATDASPSVASTKATEVDVPGDHDYVLKRATCVDQTRPTDMLKGVATEVEKEVRKGITISLADEQRLGREMIANFEKDLGGKLTRDGSAVRYLAEVGKSLAPAMSRKDVTWTFYFWEDTTVVNALALPGGHVVMSRPLFEKWLDNEAQLATVIGHEMAHIDERHPLAVVEVMRSLGLPEADALSRALVAIARVPYQAVQEEEADRGGAKAMDLAGYSVLQAVALWDERSREVPARPKQDNPLGILIDETLHELENLTATHPAPQRRACLLRQVSYDLYGARLQARPYVGTTNLKRQVSRSQQVF